MQPATQYPGYDTKGEQLYFTSDNLAFFDEQAATSHAGKLEDKLITTKTKDEVDTEARILADTWTIPGYDPLDEPDAE